MNGKKSSTPFVSVIIPNYNHSSFLKQRIDSVINQTFADFELIILDDCSTDNSKEIIEGYRGHNQISHIIYNETNSGNTFKQWQKGIDLAKGDWIWIAESDDFADIDYLKSCIENIEGTSSLVFTRSIIIDENGNLSSYLGCDYFPNSKYFNEFDTLSLHPDRIAFLTQEMYNFNHIVNASSVIFKKSKAPDLTSFMSRFKLCGDWMFWIKLIENGDLVYIDKGLNYFRSHSSTVRNNSQNQLFAFFENAEITNYIYSKLGNSTLKKKYSDYLIFIYFNRYSLENRKGTFFKFLQTIRLFGLRAIVTALKKRLVNA